MLLLTCGAEVDSLKHLLEPGSAVNAPRDFCQSPVQDSPSLCSDSCNQELTAINRILLEKLQYIRLLKLGAWNISVLLVASDALIDLYNKDGQTAKDLAWSCGFLECAKFLTTVKYTESMKLSEQSKCSFKTYNCGLLLKNKRAYRNVNNSNGKKQRSDCSYYVDSTQ